MSFKKYYETKMSEMLEKYSAALDTGEESLASVFMQEYLNYEREVKRLNDSDSNKPSTVRDDSVSPVLRYLTE